MDKINFCSKYGFIRNLNQYYLNQYYKKLFCVSQWFVFDVYFIEISSIGSLQPNKFESQELTASPAYAKSFSVLGTWNCVINHGWFELEV